MISSAFNGALSRLDTYINHRNTTLSRGDSAHKDLHCDNVLYISSSRGFSSPKTILFLKLCMVMCITTSYRRRVCATTGPKIRMIT
jgi:hypothetical protein